MRRRGGALLGLVSGLASCLSAAPALAETTSYAIVIGNNQPPAEASELGPLRYADDDAIRYAELFGRLGQVSLLTRLDSGTQRRQAAWKSLALPPSFAQLKSQVEALAQQIEKDRARGATPVVFITFSGHGNVSAQGEYYLSLEDAPLTRQKLYDEVLEPLRHARVHLIVDACQAAGAVGARGAFDHELDAKTAAIDPAEAQAQLSRYSLARFPNVGVLLASNTGQVTHEWSQIEAGVFTYELTSALLGAADVNGDLRIEYGEVAAFVAAAHRQLVNPDAAPALVARAPRDAGPVLLELTQLRRTQLLAGRAEGLGRFYIELRNGQRWLTAHPADAARVSVALPVQAGSFLHAGEREAEIPVSPGGVVRLEQLHFVPVALASRGSVERALEASWFAEPFGPAFYRRFALHSDLPGVRLDVPAAEPVDHARAPDSRWQAYGFLGLAGASAISAGVSSYLGLRSYQRFQGEARERQAAELRGDVLLYRNVALISSAVMVGAGAGAWLSWPRTGSRVAVSANSVALVGEF